MHSSAFTSTVHLLERETLFPSKFVNRMSKMNCSEYFHIATNNCNGLVIGIRDRCAGSGPLVLQERCGLASQLWKWESNCILKSKENNQIVMDVVGSGKTSGTQVIAYSEHGGKNQQWCKEGDRIISQCNNLALDIEGGVVKVGAKIIVTAKDCDNSQQWFFITE